MSEPRPSAQEWALELYGKSVLKQRKVAELVAKIGATEGLRCLDLGSDNGVVSLLLRRRGGRWASADLTPEAVASIRLLVGDDVHLVQDGRLPFADGEFDVVAVVDMLEHVPDDTAFAREVARVTRPGGRLVVNTPHRRETWLRRLRHRLGQTDERHGHLRPGYSAADLQRLFGSHFALGEARTYSRTFSEVVDTAVNWGLDRLGKKGSAKGMVVTAADTARHAGAFRAWAALYPFAWAITRLDVLVPTPGYMLIAAATRRGDG